ncbi:MAG: PEP/pyruvate-binding domain-containing protein [Tepidisphaeraceae bacterium]
MNDILSLAQATTAASVGGKAASLGKLIRAGFPVPDGFVILPPNTPGSTTNGNGHAHAGEVVGGAFEILAAYARLGRGTVAVRSSATAEDGAVSSMAGQFETVLNVEGDAELLDAVRHCRTSVGSDRVRAYINERGIAEADVRMAVVVQKQINADIAGVLFTAAPDSIFPRQMLIEASFGLGESVVSGRVQPDILRVDFHGGQVVETTIARKLFEITRDGERAIEPARQNQPCLDSLQVHALWKLARRAEEHFGCPQDIEWAVADGQLYLLQSRPITTHANAAEVESAVLAAREEVTRLKAAGHGPWVVHNLAETLPRPTPLTWSLIRRYMSADGGYGRAYQAAGFAPRGEFLDRIGGRIYMDATRAPKMFSADFPFAYDPEVLRNSADASQQPPTIATGSVLRRWRAGRMLARVDEILDQPCEVESAHAAETLEAFVAESKRIDLRTLSAETLAKHWATCEANVLDVYGSVEVLAGLRAGRAMVKLQQAVAEHAWDEDAAALAAMLSSGGAADEDTLADESLYRVGRGETELHAWLAAHGHRGVGEMDLASPRWRDDPAAATEAAGRMAAGAAPAERHVAHVAKVTAKLDEICRRLSRGDAFEFRAEVAIAQKAVAGREFAKDRLMLGYELLRDIAREIGRRMGADDDAFFLTRDELLETLERGYTPVKLIAERRAEYAAQQRVRWPAFIESAEDVGTTASVRGEAIAISAGEADGVVRVMRTINDTPPLPGEILVCPSTDPAWTPVLTGVAGLVIEVGGVLSHGAVVARELGVPAVVVPDATERFKTGDRIHIDGTTGRVRQADQTTDTQQPDDTRIQPRLTPPPAGAKDRRAARLRNAAAAVWALYLLAVFLLPETRVRAVSLAAIDAVLWPVAGRIGWPVTVAVIAVVTGVATLLLQRRLTDNRRLREAKRRAGVLSELVALLPAESRRRAVMRRMISEVTLRGLGASLVPVGVLLGPMVVMFVWLGDRADPKAWNAPAGSGVRVVATVDGEFLGSVKIAVPNGVTVDETTPATQKLPALRSTLERLLTLYRQPATQQAAVPWELTIAPDPARTQSADQLKAYLDAGIPQQTISWLVHPNEHFDGRFSVEVSAENVTRQIGVTVGPSSPPSVSSVAGSAPLRSVRIVYPPAKVERHFLRVFNYDIGWLGVYVVAYVVTLPLVSPLGRGRLRGNAMRVLVVEDEPDLLEVLAQSLREDGYAVDEAADGNTGLFKAEGNTYDAVILDLMLPGMSGWEVLKKLRKTKATPVLILTARDATPDRVQGLDAGADDYLTKPFELVELQARLRALIRRSAGQAEAKITVGDVTLDTAQRVAYLSGEAVNLTPREYALVELLALHKGKLVSRSMIYDHLFDENSDTLSNLVDVHIAHVRRKLGRDFIVTRRGEGYMVHA